MFISRSRNHRGERPMKQVIFSDETHIEADINERIECGTDTERIAARCLKAMCPLLKEIIDARELTGLSGFIMGISQVCASMVASLPDDMRDEFSMGLAREIEKGLVIAKNVARAKR